MAAVDSADGVRSDVDEITAEAQEQLAQIEAHIRETSSNDETLTPQEAVARADSRIQAMRDRDFIKEHGRLMLDETHPTFDAFRRLPTPDPPRKWLRILMSIILVPIRILVALIGALISYVIVIMIGPKVTKKMLHQYDVQHISPWRRRACEIATRILARSLLFFLGFWRVYGKDAVGYDDKQARGATIVSNHVGVGDPCLLAYVYAPAFVAKMAIAKLPLVGRVGAAQHSFYIDRFNGGTRNTTAAIIERQILAADPEKRIPPVCIFPEGTTTNGRYLLRFRTGAFVAGLPVAPILLKYPHKYFSPSLEAIKTVDYVLGLVSQPYNRVHYYRLPVYVPTAAEREDAKLYADNVRKMMEEYSDFLDGCKMALSDANFVDKKEYLAVVRGGKLQAGLQLRR